MEERKTGDEDHDQGFEFEEEQNVDDYQRITLGSPMMSSDCLSRNS